MHLHVSREVGGSGGAATLSTNEYVSLASLEALPLFQPMRVFIVAGWRRLAGSGWLAL